MSSNNEILEYNYEDLENHYKFEILDVKYVAYLKENFKI